MLGAREVISRALLSTTLSENLFRADALRLLASKGSASSPICFSVVDGLRPHYRRAASLIDVDTSSRAFTELRRAKGGYSDSDVANGGVACYRKGAVKLPSTRAGHLHMSDFLPASLVHGICGGDDIFMPGADLCDQESEKR